MRLLDALLGVGKYEEIVRGLFYVSCYDTSSVALVALSRVLRSLTSSLVARVHDYIWKLLTKLPHTDSHTVTHAYRSYMVPTCIASQSHSTRYLFFPSYQDPLFPVTLNTAVTGSQKFHFVSRVFVPCYK